ncbi:hypothetical protein [Streptomyces canus]|uniref:hypothetical protein n=1 Tax=Streptomyces canus TaxID=58343 RepID=UPI0027D7F1E0|nr:hypothetical protein [Streptomyces canus]
MATAVALGLPALAVVVGLPAVVVAVSTCRPTGLATCRTADGAATGGARHEAAQHATGGSTGRQNAAQNTTGSTTRRHTADDADRGAT